MNKGTPPFRVGVFDRITTHTEGGADTLLRELRGRLTALSNNGSTEIIRVSPKEWSYKRKPARYLWWLIARFFGVHAPLWDFRPACRRHKLDMAYLAVPIYARIDIPFVFTLWDLGHRTLPEFPEMDTAGELWRERDAMCREMLPRASHVVVGNSIGAAEACHSFGLVPEKVSAIPFPNPNFTEIVDSLPAWVPRRPYFFYPAQYWPHKNHITILHALAQCRERGHDSFDLVLVGADKGNLTHVQAAAHDLGLGDRVHFGGFVERAELKALYVKAAGLVFPSLLGPNNLPPQEAAVLGCPIILSDLAGHREQLRDGAIYVDPLNVEAWAEAMIQLVNDSTLRSKLVAQAHMAVANYTIENYSGKLRDIFAAIQSKRLLWREANDAPLSFL